MFQCIRKFEKDQVTKVWECFLGYVRDNNKKKQTKSEFVKKPVKRKSLYRSDSVIPTQGSFLKYAYFIQRLRYNSVRFSPYLPICFCVSQMIYSAGPYRLDVNILILIILVQTFFILRAIIPNKYYSFVFSSAHNSCYIC